MLRSLILLCIFCLPSLLPLVSGQQCPGCPSPSLRPTPLRNDLRGIISEDTYNEMFPRRNDPSCPANGFYTYNAFIDAANSYPDFGTTGDSETRKREIAAFFGQTSHETTGGWPLAPGGPYTWGYCYVEEIYPQSDYCVPSVECPCAPGKKYYGRGPIQLTYNYNYCAAGKAIGYDLLSDPDKVAKDPTISFETALWFWMTPQPPKPSCHDVMTGQYTPSQADIDAGRVPGYGLCTNIINGGIECGFPTPAPVEDRVGFYKRYCDLFGIDYGDNLYCYKMQPYGLTAKHLLPDMNIKARAATF